jgi:uncharacterized protein
MTAPVTSIGPADIPALAAGCAILGTGGGGSVTTSQLAVGMALEEFGPVRVMQVDEITGDDLVVCMSAIGAPTVGIEMIPAAHQAETLLREVESFAGRKVTALMAAEIGGSNGVGPVGWAARLGIAVLDADGMGRAFPQATMVSMNAAGVPCDFTVLCDVVGNVIAMKTVDLSWLERHARAVTVASGSLCLGAHYPLTADTIKGAVIEGTVTRAIEVGRALLGASDPVAGLAEVLGADVLITGKVTDVERRTEGGFVRGSVTIAGTGADRDRLQRVELQNENLVVLEDGEVIATVPDLITIVDAETGHAISTELLRFGQRVAVVAWPCDPLWRTERGLELVGPAAFGYDLPYHPIVTGGAR